MKECYLEKLCKPGQEYPSVIYYFSIECYFSDTKYFLNFYYIFFLLFYL